MKKIFTLLTPASLLALPIVTLAQGGGNGLADGNAGGGEFGDLLATILQFSNEVLIPVILGIGFLVFVWGMFVYFVAGGANEEQKERGKSLMVYAVLGFVLIVIFWGVINLIANSIGLEGESIDEIPPNVQI